MFFKVTTCPVFFEENLATRIKMKNYSQFLNSNNFLRNESICETNYEIVWLVFCSFRWFKWFVEFKLFKWFVKSVRKASSQSESESSKKDLNSSNLVSDISCKKKYFFSYSNEFFEAFFCIEPSNFTIQRNICINCVVLFEKLPMRKKFLTTFNCINYFSDSVCIALHSLNTV